MLEPVAVTGVGAITSLGRTAPATWAQLIEGRSGIRAITRFPVAGLATTIAGCVDVAAPDLRVWSRTYAMAEHALAEALVHRRRNRINASAVVLRHDEPTWVDQADGKESG
jgi:3-oxoacyl-[acyl-carrier-protein] synthase II